MASSRHSRPVETHLLFRGLFADWHDRAGVLSALPDAPVLPDNPRRRRLATLWAPIWREALKRAAIRGRAPGDRRAPVTACTADRPSAQSSACC
jgi:hypothetical protein